MTAAQAESTRAEFRETADERAGSARAVPVLQGSLLLDLALDPGSASLLDSLVLRNPSLKQALAAPAVALAPHGDAMRFGAAVGAVRRGELRKRDFVRSRLRRWGRRLRRRAADGQQQE